MAIQLTEPGAPVALSKNVVALGIDLGTTNSAVAILKEGTPYMILDQAGHALTPSVVDYEGEFPVVGHAALAKHNQGAPSTVASIKRLLDPDAATLDLFHARYDVAVNSAPGALSQLTVGDKILNPIQISSDILHHLKVHAEEALGQEISYAVITVPAYFSEAARSATRLAAKMAGLKVLRLLNEPTAAAVAYGLDAQKKGMFLVYDLGGGTFDVSILNLEDGVFQVVATDGLATLGGDNIDQLIVEDILKKHPNIAPSQKSLKELSAQARAVKEHLSDTEKGQWEIVIGNQTIFYTLTRADLEVLLQPFILSTMEIVERALKAAKISADRIEEVLLVGGSTRIPALKKALAQLFKRAPKDTIDPDQIVAQGAAVQAHALTHGSDTLLLDVTPLSLGLETMGGIVEKILPRNTPIPAAVSQEFTTYQDGQTALSLHIVQGEREFSKDCRSLGKFSLTGIPPMLAGVPRIEITFTLDADGLLTVNAMEKETGLLQQIEIQPSHGLTEDEIRHMIQSSHKHGTDDITARLATDAEVKERKMSAALKRL